MLSFLVLLLAVSHTSPPQQGEPLKDVSLFARAQKFGAIKLEGTGPYAWLNNTTLLVGSQAGENEPLQLKIYNRKGQVPGAVAKVNKNILFLDLEQYAHFKLAPNRKSVLLYAGNGPCYAANLEDGTCKEVNAVGYHTEGFWVYDSRHFLRCYYGNNGHLLAYLSLTISDRLSEAEYNIPNLKSNPIYTENTIAFGSYNGELVTLNSDVSDYLDSTANLHVFRRSFLSPNSQTAITSIRLKQKSVIASAVLSPNCTRIAVVQESVGLPLSNQKGRDKRNVLCLWVSTTTGSEAKQVGCIIRSGEHGHPSIDDLQWLPDGKRLSFVYKGGLYVVPVNGPDFSRFVTPAGKRTK